jgi:hypothetical protein
MVVLEGGGMLTTGSNQYLQPDYLSPLPTTVSYRFSVINITCFVLSKFLINANFGKENLHNNRV